MLAFTTAACQDRRPHTNTRTWTHTHTHGHRRLVLGVNEGEQLRASVERSRHDHNTGDRRERDGGRKDNMREGESSFYVEL